MFDAASDEFVVKFRRGHESQHVERFKDEIAFRTRLAALDQELNEQHWQRVHPPVLKADGWKI